MTELAKRVRAFVTKYPHSAAADIHHAFRKKGVQCTKTAVNSALYAGKRSGLFVFEDPSRLRWRLATVSLRDAKKAFASRLAERVTRTAAAAVKPIPVPRGGRDVTDQPRREVRMKQQRLYKWQEEALAEWQSKHTCSW